MYQVLADVSFVIKFWYIDIKHDIHWYSEIYYSLDVVYITGRYINTKNNINFGD